VGNYCPRFKGEWLGIIVFGAKWKQKVRRPKEVIHKKNLPVGS
jgi:hypothetical protein